MQSIFPVHKRCLSSAFSGRRTCCYLASRHDQSQMPRVVFCCAEEYSVVHADPAGDEVMESPRKQTGASQAAAANAGSAAAVEPSGKHKKLWKATPAAAASLSEAGPGVVLNDMTRLCRTF